MGGFVETIISAGTACLAALTTVPHVASAGTVDSFRIRQLYSNQDGDYQFIELEEIGGRNDENQFAELTLSVADSRGVTKTYVFPANLPSAATANKHVLIVSSTHAVAGANHDFIMPDRFLPTGGGTIDFAGIDRWTFGALPRGGEIYRDEHPIPSGIAETFTGTYVGCCWGTTAGVREYYNAILDQYFMSSMEPDIDALESGRIPGWQKLGTLFRAWSDSWGNGDLPLSPPPVPVCRYFIPPASHFFSASVDECADIARIFPEFVLETRDAFYAYLPDATTGACPSVVEASAILSFGPIPLQPLYRLWNARRDTNHRFTTSRASRDRMIQEGWISEGYGPDGVALCVSSQ